MSIIKEYLNEENRPSSPHPLRYLLGVSGDGKRILYAVTAPFTPLREPQETGVFQKDLETGRVIRAADTYHESAPPVYLGDGSMLVPALYSTCVRDHPGLDPLP